LSTTQPQIPSSFTNSVKLFYHFIFNKLFSIAIIGSGIEFLSYCVGIDLINCPDISVIVFPVCVTVSTNDALKVKVL
jgi:hypothetical protein